jgi:purine-nucleoside phosphorylase
LSQCIDPKSALTVNYEDIPGFPLATVAGHMGEMVFGTINGIEIVCLRGRFHYYEGNSMETVGLPVRVMRLLGVKLLLVTNAAGGLNPEYNVGDIAVIQDHFGMPLIAGNHPLRGVNDDSLGPRFPAVSDAYDEDLQTMILNCAAKLNLGNFLRPNATYCFVSGPAYESKAECRFLRSIGGDTVGMSTIPEIITAKHAGMKILCLSLVTNKVVFTKQVDTVHASHQEVLQAVQSSGKRVEALVTALITKENLQGYLDNLPTISWSPKRGLGVTLKRTTDKAIKAVQQSTLLQFGLLAAAATAGYLLASRRR